MEKYKNKIIKKFNNNGVSSLKIINRKIKNIEKQLEIYNSKNLELKKICYELMKNIEELKEFNGKLIVEIEERKRLLLEAEYLMYHDSLTGVYNRNYFEQDGLRKVFKNAESLGIIFCDIDLLKLINDIFGHLIGDKLIGVIAGMLKESVKQEHIIIRMGGDEFIIIMINSTEEEAKGIYNNISQKAGKVILEKIELPIFFSLGLSFEKGKNLCIEEILKKADENMYKCKLNHKKFVEKEVWKNIINNFNKYEAEYNC